MRVEFARAEMDSRSRRRPAPGAVFAHQRLLEVAQHPLVQRAGELFGAQPVRVDDPTAALTK